MTSPEYPRRRAVAYIRESTEEQGEGVAPETQRRSIRDYAERNKLDLIDEYIDLQSGWKDSEARPSFRRMIDAAAQNAFDVILVFHTSRFARDRTVAARYKSLLRDKDVAVISVTQSWGEDPESPSSMLLESINEALDEYYSVQLSFWIGAALATKAASGHLIGSLPWGYVRDPDTKTAIPDLEKATAVVELFRRYATGDWSYRQLAIWLNGAGFRTNRDAAFSAAAVREMISNKAYAGYVTKHRQTEGGTEGLHAPIIDLDLFEQAQAVKTRRRAKGSPGRTSPRGYALSRIARCARCDGQMHGCKSGNPSSRLARYACSNKRRDGSCDQPMARADEVEDELARYVQHFRPTLADKKSVVRLLKASRASLDASEDDHTRQRLETALNRNQQLYRWGHITEAEYLLERQSIRRELDKIQPPPVDDIELIVDQLIDFAGAWRQTEGDRAEQNRLFSAMFHRVWIDAGRLVAVEPRREYLPYFQGDLARQEKRERRDSNPRPPA